MPADALGWLNIFIVYVALPALFFKLISRTPVEQLTRFDFIITDVGTTYAIFGVIFVIGWLGRDASIPEATVQGLAAAYGNIGYMARSGASGIRRACRRACCADLLLREYAAFHRRAGLDRARRHKEPTGRAVCPRYSAPYSASSVHHRDLRSVSLPRPCIWRCRCRPQRLVDYLAQAAAPCALFAMGVTLALRP